MKTSKKFRAIFIVLLVTRVLFPVQMFGQVADNVSFKSANSLPLLLDTIVKSVSKQFENIQGELISKNDNSSYYKSLITVQDAKSTILDKWLYFTYLKVNYGEFSKKEDAEAKLAAVKQQIKSYFPKADYAEYKPFFSTSKSYILINKTDKSLQYFPIEFYITQKNNGLYEVWCNVKGGKDKPSFIEYYPITENPKSSTFSTDLQLVMAEADKDFKSLQGEKVASTWITEYKATKCLDKAYYCIISSGMIGTTYKAVFGRGIEESKLIESIDGFGGYVAEALGKDYYYNYLPNKKGFGFTHKANLTNENKHIITIESQKQKDGTYTVSLLVHRVAF